MCYEPLIVIIKSKKEVIEVNKKGIIISFILVAIVILTFSNNYYNKKLANIANTSKVSILSDSEVEKEWVNDSSKIVFSSFNGKIDIFIKGSKEDSDRYIGYHIRHSSLPLDRTLAASNFDVWNLVGANEFQRINKMSFLNKSPVVTAGEWEMALFEEGANDFIGGTLHGDEIVTEYKLLADGEPVSLDGKVELEVDSLTFNTISELFRDNTTTEDVVKIGTHKKTYLFSKNGLTVDQEINFEKSMTLKKSYLAMLPTLRKSEGATGGQITDTVKTNPESPEYDVSEEGFDLTELRNVSTNKVELWGKESGFKASVEILKKTPEIMPSIFHISDAPAYNKIYFGFNEDGQRVEVGDTWQQTTQYKIDTTN